MKKLRKALVVSVMSITVLSMSMLSVPMQVGAAAQSGDLIKMNGLSSVYYLGADGKRYVFPNEATYFSWYSDFSGVVTIPQAELESYPLGKNVTVRPGTKLVKITTNPKVYAVEANGTLVGIPDEATAKTLYGNDWAKRVVDVPDGFFTNYTVSTDTVSATAYPTGSLVKFGTSADVYYIDADGKARKITSEAVMTANRFKMSDVITATIAMPVAGADITAAEAGLTDTSSGAGGTANAGTGLSIALSGDTAASASLPSLSYLVPFMSVNLTAAADGAVTVNEMIFNRVGTGVYGDFDGGYLYVGSERLSTKKSVTSDNIISFTALGLNIPAGTTKVVTLKMNALTGANTSHAFKLASASAIVTNGAVVSGTFPIQGNTMSYSSSVDAGSITFDGANSDVHKKVGETNVVLGEFDMNVGAGEDLKIYSLKLKQNGTADYMSVNNLSLEIDGDMVAEGLSLTSDKYLVVTLDTPYTLEKNKNVTAYVKGDIISDINKTVEFVLKNDGDIDVRGTAYGDNYSPTITRTAFDETGDVDTITVDGSDIDVSFDGPLASDIKDDTKDVVFANFKIKSNSEDVNIDTMRVLLTLTTGDAATDMPDNVEMVDTTNNVSYTVSDPATGATANLDFENITLTKGVQYNFQIRGDIPDGASTGETYTVSISFASNFTAYFQDTDETAVSTSNMSSTSLNGKTMTVAAPSITFDPVITSATSYVENTDKVLLFKGKITANAVSDLKLSKVKLEDTITTATYWGDGFEKLYLCLASDVTCVTPLDTETSLSTATDITFSGFNVTVPKGTSNGIYLVVRGDVKNNPTAGGYSLGWSNNGTDTSDYTVKDANNDALATGASSYIITDTAGQVSTIVSAGTFTMAFDNDYEGLKANKNVLAGAETLVGRIKLTASNEEVKLEDFTIENFAGSAISTDVAYLKLYDNAQMTGTPLGTATIDANRRATFSDVNITIPKTTAKYIFVGATVKGISYNTPASDQTATAGRTVTLEIASSTAYAVKALGLSTGDQLANNGVASTTRTNTSTVMGAIISAVTTTFANTPLTTGLQDIFSFKITVPASTNVDYNKDELGVKLATTTFKVSTSAGVAVSGFKVQRVGGSTEHDAVYNGSTASYVENTGHTFVVNFRDSFSTDTDLIVSPGETAEFVVRGDITGVDTSDSLRVTIEDLGTTAASSLSYVHNTTGASTYTSAVYTLLPGVTYVRGGSLTN